MNEFRFSPAIALVAILSVIALITSIVAIDSGGGSTAAPVALEDGAAPAGDTPADGDPAEVVPVSAEPGSGGTASVGLIEFAIEPDAIVLGPSGTIEVTNNGAIPHNLVLDGYEEQYGTIDLNAGDAANIDLSGLEPGEYPLYCSIVGHAESGMTGTLVIDAAGPAAAAEGEVDGESLTGMERAEWLRANYEASVSQFPAETAAMGNQPMEPEIGDNGEKVFELTLDEVEWEVAPGDVVEAVGYNGQVPGPWIQVDVGDEITIRIVNELDDEATTLHPHGIFMHPFEVDGVGMISMEPIMPGDVWEQTFVAQETSVGMYHGHDNGVHQVINGAFGAFTVGQVPLPAVADNVVAEDVMILNDAGEIGLTLNAKSFPATAPYVLTEGEQMILHYYNEGLSAHPMHLHNNAQMVIAKDGYPLATPIVMDTVNVAPGERYTVVIFAEVPGTWVYHCHILSHVERDDGSVFGMFTALIVEPSDDPDVNADLSRELGRDQVPSFPGQEAAATPDTGEDEPDADEPDTDEA